MNTLPNNSSKVIESLDTGSAAGLISHVSDAVMVINHNGIIENIQSSQAPGLQVLNNLIGKSIVECVAPDSKKKISELTAGLKIPTDFMKDIEG